MSPCPFCARIKAGDYDSAPGSGNPGVVWFEPLNPVTPGHLLVVPVRHVTDALEDPDLTGRVFAAAARLADELDDPSCNLITSVGAAATQSVYHLHVHLIPRRDGDGLHLPWAGQDADTEGEPVDWDARAALIEEMEKAAAVIAEAREVTGELCQAVAKAKEFRDLVRRTTRPAADGGPR